VFAREYVLRPSSKIVHFSDPLLALSASLGFRLRTGLVEYSVSNIPTASTGGVVTAVRPLPRRIWAHIAVVHADGVASVRCSRAPGVAPSAVRVCPTSSSASVTITMYGTRLCAAEALPARHCRAVGAGAVTSLVLTHARICALAWRRLRVRARVWLHHLCGCAFVYSFARALARARR
jgi:hypothetical protein